MLRTLNMSMAEIVIGTKPESWKYGTSLETLSELT